MLDSGMNIIEEAISALEDRINNRGKIDWKK